ncbi:HAD-IIA family hydrolase [Clostridium sp. YIM B02515]|uniref:HAD-IIA family hydrolase n=1 Tax=Clostridium rhizosphaerae TaxID=2803861 RepID=A0ABS1TJ25_9CLOT|nr:HAD-IIA family hydrolase [Clostridium rhizosphaerae]MBL4938586.1 HAD-IIA family hydrolase [Clostridium rhizosphaerae]
MRGKIDTILFDLDGTLYAKGKPIKSAVNVIETLRKEKVKLAFITNTDGWTVEHIHKRLIDMGFNIALEEVFTPVAAVKQFFADNKDKSCYLLVTDEVFESLKGLKLNDINPDYVVVGDFSDKTNYEEINKVFRFIMNGSEILALSKANYYFQDNGININTGAFVGMFEKACEKEAVLLGKPSKEFFNLALNRLGSKAESTIVVGDDITVDITGAKAVNAISVLVTTGHYNEEIVKSFKEKPDYIIEDITHLPSLLMEE